MLQSFKNFISANDLFTQEHKLLLALSGGSDSVCLFHLLREGGFSFSVAHCNFKLRGEESDADEQFVVDLAKSYNVPCYSVSFNTALISLDLKTGIQETARKLRYDWFLELIEMHGFYKLITAHHQTDNLETMLINILRSTGVRGLHGIPLNDSRICRPLLFATRNEIDAFIKDKNYHYREDRSNASDNYLRNELRHFVLPQLKSIQPDAERRFFDTARKVKSYEDLADELIRNQWVKIALKDNNGEKIDISKLDEIKNKIAFLYYNMQSYGFTYQQLESIVNTRQIGKRIMSETHELNIERGYYIVNELIVKEPVDEIWVNESNNHIEIDGYNLEFKIIKNSGAIDLKNKDVLYIDAGLFNWPLKIRLWKEGDKLKPLGMGGYKKISDILTDRKVANHLRKRFFVIENIDNEILVLLPATLHNDYKISTFTEQILSIGIKIADS